MAERRDPRRPRPPTDRPVFHFDTGRQDHDDAPYSDVPYDDFVDHVDEFVDHVDEHDDHEDHGQFFDDHYDSAHGDGGDRTEWLLDRLQSLIQSIQRDLVSRHQRLEHLVRERLTAVENEAARVVRELGEHVHELGRRVDEATGDGPPPEPRPPRGPRG